jgi:hypothetical protein
MRGFLITVLFFAERAGFTGIYGDINIPTKGRLMCAKATYFLAVAKWCYLSRHANLIKWWFQTIDSTAPQFVGI